VLEQGQAPQALPYLQEVVRAVETAKEPTLPWQKAYARFLVARASWEAGHGRAAALQAARAELPALAQPEAARLRRQAEGWLARRTGKASAQGTAP
jgi:hypothetical protein